MWLTDYDLLTVFDDVAADDPDGERDLDLLKTLVALFEDPFTVADIVSAINDKSGAGSVVVSDDEFDDVPDAECDIPDVLAPDRARLLEQLELLLEIPSRFDDRASHIGRRFRRMRNRVVQGLKLVRASERKPTKWRIERQKP